MTAREAKKAPNRMCLDCLSCVSSIHGLRISAGSDIATDMQVCIPQP